MERRNETQPNRRKPKKFTTKMQSTLLLLFCGIIVFLIILIIVIGRIIYKDSKRFTKRVLGQQTYVSSTIPYKRGDIVDRNGTILATSVKVYNLILDVKLLLQYEEYVDTTLQAINTYFEIPLQDLYDLMDKKSDSSYVVLKKEIDSDVYDAFEEFRKVKENKVKGVWFEEEYKRIYPNNKLGSLVVGFTYTGDDGAYGIEKSYQNELIGTNGLSYGYFDSNLNLERINKEAKNGNTIVTTLDANVQRIVEKKINELNEQYPAKRISVLVMNPNNGDIYSMATNTQYDLNQPRDLTPFYSKSEIEDMSTEEQLDALFQIWRNSIISDIFEPGSTFKPFTIAAALEENFIGFNDEFLCDGGEFIPGNPKRIKCNHTHGRLDLTHVIMKSCNDSLMQIGAKIGRHLFYQYQTSFLFGQKTGIDLPGEGTGIIKSEDNISPTDLAVISFGQTDEVTMVQLAAAFSSLINGGYYYEPHVMKQIETDKGTIVKRNDGVLVKQTISSDTSDFLKNALYMTVDDPKGTAGGAKVEGYAIGGKTGTAQKYPRTDDTFILSFIGAVPMDDPEVVIYVTLDEVQDKTRYKDSSLATSFAGSVLKEILPFLGVYPTGDIDYSIWGLDPSQSDKKTESNSDETENTEEGTKEEEIVVDPNEEADENVIDDDIKPAEMQNGTIGEKAEGDEPEEAPDVNSENPTSNENE